MQMCSCGGHPDVKSVPRLEPSGTFPLPDTHGVELPCYAKGQLRQEFGGLSNAAAPLPVAMDSCALEPCGARDTRPHNLLHMNVNEDTKLPEPEQEK